MKFKLTNSILIYLFLGFSFFAKAQTIVVNDANFKTHLLSLVDAANGGDNDGEIQTSEAETLTDLIYSGQNLTDATGLEAFVNLTSLNLNDNALSSIDLSTLTKLESIDLAQNSLLTLDLSSCTALTYLQVGQNLLTGLNVNFCTGLTTLYAYSNDLVSIDVSSNTLLGELRLFDNELTALDVSANTMLTSLQVYTNNLTSLDVTNNTMLTDFSAMFNSLGTIDLSNNTMLTSLTLYSVGLTSIDLATNTMLETLILNDNNLNSIDLSTNTELTDLRLFSNDLTALDLSNNGKLELASLYYNDLTSIDLSQNTLLTVLSVTGNNLTTIDVSANTELANLNISENPITFLDLSVNTKLIKFTAFDCDLHSLGIKNGMNTSISTANFNITGNVNLTCVEVDDVTYANANWTNKDAGASFNTVCAPTALTFSPAKSSSGVSISTKPTITFSEQMKLFTGPNRSVYLYKSDGTQIGGYASNNPGNNMSIDGNVLTIYPDEDLEYETSYNVRINYGAIQDLAGNDYAGFNSHLVWVFSTEAAPDVVWNGAVWNNGVGPTAADNVVLDENYTTSVNGIFECKNLTTSSGKTLMVDGDHTLIVNGHITNTGNLTVESGASLITYSGKNITGNWINIKRTTRYGDGKYSFVGTPMGLATFNNGASIGNPTYQYLEYEPYGADGLGRWESVNELHYLQPGQGYAQAFKKELTFTGRPNSGTITYSGSYTEDADDANEGWHLVSNPYPAAIFIDAFLDANMNTTDAIYIWDDNGSHIGRGSNNDYIVANKTAATDISGANNQARWNEHIGSAQGFFVQLDGSAGDIIFTENMRRSGNNADANFFRNAENETPILRLNLTHADGLIRQAIVGWNEAVSNTEIAEGYDAKVFSNTADYQIYTTKANSSLAIQTVNSQISEIPVGIRVAEAGTYTIDFNLEHLTSPSLYLLDNITGDRLSVVAGPYSFTTSAGHHTDRFVLTTASKVLALEDQETNIYALNKILHIKTTGSQPAQYQIYNLSGVSVMKAFVNGSTQIDLSHLNNGIYIVSDGIETKKIILK